jgi:uncharacterized protein (TIRG00374 family)
MIRFRQYRKLIFWGVAVAGVAVLAFQLSQTKDLDLRSTNISTLAIYGGTAIILQMTGHWLRAVKHRYLLEQIRPIHTREVFKGQMIGLLFNTILPFRLGEVVRAHYIGKGVSISRSAVFATILFERLFDAAVLACIGIILLLNASGSHSHSLEYTVSILIVGTIVLGSFLWAARAQQSWVLRSVFHASAIFNAALRDRIRMMCWSGIYCLKNVVTLRRMPRYVALTAAMWTLYITSAYVFIMGLLPSLAVFKRLLAAVAVYFGVSVPSGPAYVSTFKDVFSDISTIPGALLSSTHAPFVLWLLLIVPTSLLGICLLFVKQHLYHRGQHDVLDVLRNKLYRDADITGEFSHFLDAYFNGDRINRILTTEELLNNFQVLKTFKGGSNALTFLAWQNEKMIVKKITLKQYQDKLHAQYQWLKEREHLPEIARILQEHTGNPDFYALDIEYRDNYIPFFDLIHSSSETESKRILRRVCNFVDKHIYTPRHPVPNARTLLDEYIRTKIIGKVTDAANGNLPIAGLLTYDTITVNGRKLKNFHTIIEQITNSPQAMADLTDIIDCPIQGDLTVDNIIVDPATGKFIILDPNNENAISDPVVDYGKLMQSVHSGYEFLYYLPGCTVVDNKINFEERRSVQYETLYLELNNYLKKQLSPGRCRAVLFHEAVHYCRMLTYRANIDSDTAAAFYCIAIRLFNDFMEQYKDATKS